MNKLKKGIQKYKGKFPVICFNYGKVGHFAKKFPYPKHEDSDDEEIQNHKEHKMSKKKNKNKYYKQKMNLYTKEDNISFEESEDENSELLFMGMKTQDNVVDDEEKYEF
jgi:hypothetical protein